MNFLDPYTPPQNFELDEIQWNGDEVEYPISPDFIPFGNRTKKIIKKELQRLIAQADEKI